MIVSKSRELTGLIDPRPGPNKEDVTFQPERMQKIRIADDRNVETFHRVV